MRISGLRCSIYDFRSVFLSRTRITTTERFLNWPNRKSENREHLEVPRNIVKAVVFFLQTFKTPSFMKISTLFWFNTKWYNYSFKNSKTSDITVEESQNIHAHSASQRETTWFHPQSSTGKDDLRKLWSSAETGRPRRYSDIYRRRITTSADFLQLYVSCS